MMTTGSRQRPTGRGSGQVEGYERCWEGVVRGVGGRKAQGRMSIGRRWGGRRGGGTYGGGVKWGEGRGGGRLASSYSCASDQDI